MNISLKSVQVIYWLVFTTMFLGVLLVTQLKPETYTWRLIVIQALFFIVITGLCFYVHRLFAQAISDASMTQRRRFNSKIKTQFWGLFIRSASGAAGFGLAALLLPLDFVGALVCSAVWAVLLILGFVNDGKRFDENHI